MARSKDSKQISVERRQFLKNGVLTGAAALVAPTAIARAQSAGPQDTPGPPSTPVMTLAAETAPPEADVLTTERTGSDFMVDVIKALGFEYI